VSELAEAFATSQPAISNYREVLERPDRVCVAASDGVASGASNDDPLEDP